MVLATARLARAVTTPITVGFLLAFTCHVILAAGWWNEARRNDATDYQIAAIHNQLGTHQEEPVPDPDEPATVPIPAQPATEPQERVIIEHWADGIDKPRPTPGPRRVVERELGGYVFTFKAEET